MGIDEYFFAGEVGREGGPVDGGCVFEKEEGSFFVLWLLLLPRHFL